MSPGENLAVRRQMLEVPVSLTNIIVDLTTAIFALGLHQEPKNDVEIPFFLLEIRRKLFWFSYLLDKNFATFFGRPPMINGKYCSCKMPLDLEESQLALGGEELEQVLGQLDADGWNASGPVVRSSWLRGTIISTKIREEILELSLGPDEADLQNKAR